MSRRALDPPSYRSAMGLGRVLLATLAMTSALGAAGATEVTAQLPPSTVDMMVDGAPSVLPTVEPRLFRGDADVTARYCSAYATIDDDPRPQRTCPDIPDGTYSVRMLGLPDGAVVGWTCADNLVAGLADPAALPVDIEQSFGRWGCSATVAMPGVVVTTAASDLDEGVLGVGFEDALGATVDPTCELDDFFGDQRQWCTGFVDTAVYRAFGLDVPTGKRAYVSCYPTIVEFGDRGNTGDGPDRFQNTAARPLSECGAPLPFAPLEVYVFDNDDTNIDEIEPWLFDIEVSVTAIDGVVIDGACRPVDTFAEQAITDCDLATNGTYLVTVEGVPVGRRVSNDCTPVEVAPVNRPTACLFSVVSGGDDYPPTPDPTEPPVFVPVVDDGGSDPTTELPVTGSSAAPFGVVGFLLLVVGMSLAVGSRRRSLGT